MDRKDLPPDAFAGLPTPRTPRRDEPLPTSRATQPQQRIRAHVHYNAATQSIPNNTPTVVVLDTVDFDTAGVFRTSDNSFVIPTTGKVTGCWLIHGHITWEAAAAGSRESGILQDGTLIVRTHELGSNDDQSMDAFTLVNDPVPGTVFQLQVTQTSGSPLNLRTEARNTFFELIHLW